MLLIDLGHSRIKWCYREQSQQWPLAHWFAHPEEYHWPGAIAQIAWISVLDEASNQRFERLIREYTEASSIIRLRTQARHADIINAYPYSQSLGVDRWMCLLGAGLDRQSHSLIADAGSALTLDWLDPNGQHRGGMILPGLQQQQRALLEISAKLQPLSPWPNQLSAASDTANACAQGALMSQIGALDLAVQRWLDESEPKRLILTGGDAATLAPLSCFTWQIEPDLIWRGMREALR